MYFDSCPIIANLHKNETRLWWWWGERVQDARVGERGSDYFDESIALAQSSV